MTVFARRPPHGWTEVAEPLRGELERLGVPLVTSPVAEPGPPRQEPRHRVRAAFWCPPWAKRLYWGWPTALGSGGRFGAPPERELLERAVELIARDRLGPDPEESTDALLAAFQLGGFAAVERLLRYRTGDDE